MVYEYDEPSARTAIAPGPSAEAMWELPRFPLHALPKAIRDYIEGVSESYQVPSDLPACLVLAAAATAMGQTYSVQVNPDWWEPCNLFVTVAMPPASRKSAVFSEVTRPIREAEKRAKEEMMPLIKDNLQARQLLAKKVAELQKRAITAADEERQATLEEIKAVQGEMPLELRVPRLVVDDVSPEQLASLLSEHNGKISIMSAEGGIMDIIAGRYHGNVPNLDVFLKGHAGDTIRVDRRTREPDFVESSALTMGLAVQPDVVEAMGDKRAFRGRGLLARFLWSLPRSTVGYRHIDPPSVNPHVRVTYANIIAKLFRPWHRALTKGSLEKESLSLTPGARRALREFCEQIELALRPGGKFHALADWGGKLAGAAVRIAALLHGLEYPDAPAEVAISEDTMSRAIQIADYYSEHAITAYALMGVSTPISEARRILDCIQRLGGRASLREIHQTLKGSFRKVEDLRQGLSLLLKHNRITNESVQDTKRAGRKCGPIYVLKSEMAPQNPQNNIRGNVSL